MGIALDRNGDLYIADTGHNAIKKWVKNTNTLVTLADEGLNAPFGTAVSPGGDYVYIADTHNNVVKTLCLGWDNWVNHVSGTSTETPIIPNLDLSLSGLQLSRPGMPAQTLNLAPGYTLKVSESLTIGVNKTLALDGGTIKLEGRKPVLNMSGGTLHAGPGTHDFKALKITLSGGETFSVDQNGTLLLPTLKEMDGLTKAGKGLMNFSGKGINVGDKTLRISGGSISGRRLTLAGGTIEDIAASEGTAILSRISLNNAPDGHSSLFQVNALEETMTIFGSIG